MELRAVLAVVSLGVVLLAGCSSGSSTPDGISTVSVTSACPPVLPAATPLAPVLAKGVAATVNECVYPFGTPASDPSAGPTAKPLTPQTVFDDLTRIANAAVPPPEVCPFILGAPTALALTYADGSTATVVVDRGGCPFVVQGAGQPDLYLPDGVTLP